MKSPKCFLEIVLQLLAFILACVGTSQPTWLSASRGTTAATGTKTGIKVMHIGFFQTCTETIPQKGCYQMTCVPNLGTASFTFEDMNYRPLGVSVTNLNTQLTLAGMQARRIACSTFHSYYTASMLIRPAGCSARCSTTDHPRRPLQEGGG